MIARYVLALLAVAPLVHADPAKAKQHFERAETAYNLGKLDEAIAEFESAYREDPSDHSYLFNIAQTLRQAGHFERAIYTYNRYLELVPDSSRRAAIEKNVAEMKKAIADHQAADKALGDKALADKIAADKAAKEKADAELAARKAAESEANKRIRLSFDAGLTILHIRGIEDDPRAPALGGRIGVSWIQRKGGFIIDLGGLWMITTVPYEQLDMTGARVKDTAAFFTELHAIASATRTIYGPIWMRLGIGLGFSGFGNLENGNPVKPGGGGDIRMWCARADWMGGYRISPTLDFVVGIASGSVSSKNPDVPALGNVLTFETASLGLYIKI
jgi:tetratricopeptide (TPR) repeat protein